MTNDGGDYPQSIISSQGIISITPLRKVAFRLELRISVRGYNVIFIAKNAKRAKNAKTEIA